MNAITQHHKLTAIAQNGRHLGRRFAELSALLLNNENMQQDLFKANSSEHNEFIASYGYDVNSWPLIFSTQRQDEFAYFNKTLPKVINKALQIYFAGDVKAMSAYLNISEFVAELVLSQPVASTELVQRHDMLFCQNELKLIEVNTGFTIGGWQLDYLADDIAKRLSKHQQTREWNLNYRSILDNIFLYLADAILAKKGLGSSGRVLFYSEEDMFPGRDALLADFKGRFAKLTGERFSDAKLVFFTDFAGVSINSEQQVVYRGEIFDAVVLAMPEQMSVPQELFIQLLNSAMAGQVVMPDSPLHTFYGNKQLLALLHEDKVLNEIADEYHRFIARHIPWCTKLTRQTVHWRGEEIDLFELLKREQQHFVIKRSESFQGRDVIVGRSTETDEWLQYIETHAQDPFWLVQVYCEPDSIVSAGPKGGVHEVKPVLGIFDCGGQYGGCFIRGVTVQTGATVINSANGAMEYCVFEEQQKKNRLVL